MGISVLSSAAILIVSISTPSAVPAVSIIVLRYLAFAAFLSGLALGFCGFGFYFISGPYLWSHLLTAPTLITCVSLSLSIPNLVIYVAMRPLHRRAV
jgi:hypothetical protein